MGDGRGFGAGCAHRHVQQLATHVHVPSCPIQPYRRRRFSGPRLLSLGAAAISAQCEWSGQRRDSQPLWGSHAALMSREEDSRS